METEPTTLYLTDRPVDSTCPTCGHSLCAQRPLRPLHWLEYNRLDNSPRLLPPHWLYLPPKEVPIGKAYKARLRTFLTRAKRLLGRKDGTLVVLWRFSTVTQPILAQRQDSIRAGTYLVLSVFWTPVVNLDGSLALKYASEVTTAYKSEMPEWP
jgi:hypothetical protein